MADTTTNDESGSHWFRWVLLLALTIGAVAGARQWAMSKADAEFERRLLEADEKRN